MRQHWTFRWTAVVLLALPTVFGERCLASDRMDESVAQLENLGARLERDSESRIVSVDLSNCVQANAGLEHVRRLPHVTNLVLPPVVDDVGLDAICEMTSLAQLDLRTHRSITDAGLARVARMSQLKTLALPAQISDAGLRHRKGSL